MNIRLIKRPWVSLRPEEPASLTDYSESVATHWEAFVRVMKENVELRHLLRDAQGKTVAELTLWLESYKPKLSSESLVIDTDDAKQIEALGERNPQLLINTRDMSRIRHLNTLLNRSNEVLADEGIMLCLSSTSGLRRMQFLTRHPGLIGRVQYYFHFIWHRIFSRQRLTRWLYMWVTKGTNRSFPRVEILGRLNRAGFNVIFERFQGGVFFLLGQKRRVPIWDDDPTNGLLVKLPRIGYQGKQIGVYKVRTMYPYSEYLQPYMYEANGLGEEGKFKSDFRVNQLGRRIRGTWIDEIPMVINLFKGQLKLVGVRPLSRHYLSLYTSEMRDMHISVKPGLLPPFYYEEKTPQTIEEVQDSERRYIEAYRKHPFRTDWRYFWGIWGNIFFKHKRSR